MSSPTRPGSYLFYDLDTKRARYVASIRPELKREHLSALQRVDYKSGDGMDLFGYFVPGKLGIRGPLIVMPHGGPVARDYADFDGMAQYFAYKGYNVFQPQFRGGGGLGRTFEAAGHGQWGRAMQTDIEDGVQALIKQGLVSETAKRSILGASYGGYAALAAATLTPENYSCIISINGVSDLPMMLNSYDQSDPLENDIYRIWTTRIGDPETALDAVLKASPRQQMRNVKAPVLLVYGDEDDIVRPEQSREAYKTLIGLGKTAMIHELPGAGHQIHDQDQRTEMLIIIDRFMIG